MKPTIVLIFTIIGAIIGAVTFAGEMPRVLDWVYQTVSVNTLKTPGTPKAVDPATDKTQKDARDAVLRSRYEEGRKPGTRATLALLGIVIGGALGSLLGTGIERGLSRWERMPLGDKVTTFLGCLIGIIVSFPILSMLQGLIPGYVAWAVIPIFVALSATSIYVLRSMEEALPWYTAAGRRRKSGIKILDTNVLIDGRIYDVIRCGFLEGDLYVPQFVINELQHIADSSDSHRRQRGRRGLDFLKRIQSERQVDIGIHDRFAGDVKEEVDARLVKLAQALGADLVSNDYNLNKVATIQEVSVMNINELVTALRPNVLPGETMSVHILREGNQQRQGVGYLDDGTMVVVERGFDAIGSDVIVTVTQVIQTERGKMIFAEIGSNDENPGDSIRAKQPKKAF